MTPFSPTAAQVQTIAQNWGTPVFIYNEKTLIEAAQECQTLSAPFGLTVRYALKANPNRYFLKLFHEQNIHMDASSAFEAERIMAAGIPANHILLTAQELSPHLQELMDAGVEFNACSLHQLETYGRLARRPSEISVRINPGEGSGFHRGVDVAGAEGSFGIWHEQITEILETLKRHQLTVKRVHTHIGSGSDPAVWGKVAQLSIKLLHHFPDARILNLGGGFKIARVPGENAFSFETFSPLIEEIFTKFAQETGRKIQLEIEPGTFLVGNSGALLTRIQDITETHKNRFLKVDAGMTEVIRPAMYGSRHPFELHAKNSSNKEEFVHIVGHCCESSDMLTADEAIALPHAEIGDLLVMGGTGAYCAGMNTTHYNSFPQCPEVVIQKDGTLKEIRRRETMKEMLTLEV